MKQIQKITEELAKAEAEQLVITGEMEKITGEMAALEEKKSGKTPASHFERASLESSLLDLEDTQRDLKRKLRLANARLADLREELSQAEAQAAVELYPEVTAKIMPITRRAIVALRELSACRVETLALQGELQKLSTKAAAAGLDVPGTEAKLDLPTNEVKDFLLAAVAKLQRQNQTFSSNKKRFPDLEETFNVINSEVRNGQ